MAFPGAPTLSGAAAGIFANVQLLAKDTVAAILGFGPPVWGIFDQNNTEVLVADNVISLDYKRNWKIADYPIEQGGFSTYDKVTTPFDVRISLSKGGSTSDKATLLSVLEFVGASFNLYNVITPEMTYMNANIEMIGYRRTATDGVGLITVEIGLREIRQVATATFTQTAAPAAQNSTNIGNQQPQTMSTAQLSALTTIT
jgi:hypothetical protein